MIGELVLVVFNYFQLFLLVPFIIIVDIIMSKTIKGVYGGIKSSIFCCTAALVTFMPAVSISQAYICYDEMEIWIEDGEEAAVKGIDFGAGIAYVDKVLDNEKDIIRIPYGVERKIYVTSRDGCKINMQIEKAGYKDSYFISGENVENALTIYTDTPKIELIFVLCIKILLVITISGLIFEILKWIAMLVLAFITKHGGKCKYELIVFLYLSVVLVLQNPDKVDEWMPAWYVLNYTDGIGSRLLVGTLVHLFCGDYVTHEEALTFIWISLLILIGLVSILIGKIIRKSHESQKNVVFFVAVYLACPGNVAYFGRNVGRLEMYSLIFFLIGILLFEKIKNDYTRYLAIFLCTEAALAVHQGTIFYYFPLVVTVLMYELCTKFSLKTLLFTVLNFAGEFATFIYFQLFSGLRYDTLETTMHVIAGRTDMEIDTQAVRLEYFASLKENFDYGQGYFLKNYNSNFPHQKWD